MNHQISRVAKSSSTPLDYNEPGQTSDFELVKYDHFGTLDYLNGNENDSP
jgi:hypothetical protein